MRLASRWTGGAVIDRRAQERMTKLEPLAVDREHARMLGRVDHASIEPEHSQRVEHRLHALRAAGRGDQERPSRGVGQAGESP